MESVDALLDRLADRLAARLAERLAPNPTRQPEKAAFCILDRRGLAAQLRCCVDVVDRLRTEGMPELRVGDAPRFELDRVLAWLRERNAPRSASAVADARTGVFSARAAQRTKTFCMPAQALGVAADDLRPTDR